MSLNHGMFQTTPIVVRAAMWDGIHLAEFLELIGTTHPAKKILEEPVPIVIKHPNSPEDLIVAIADWVVQHGTDVPIVVDHESFVERFVPYVVPGVDPQQAHDPADDGMMCPQCGFRLGLSDDGDTVTCDECGHEENAPDGSFDPQQGADHE